MLGRFYLKGAPNVYGYPPHQESLENEVRPTQLPLAMGQGSLTLNTLPLFKDMEEKQ